MSAWDVLVNGTALNTEGSGVSDLTGFGVPPSRAYYAQSSYGRDGEVSTIGGLGVGSFGMTLWVDDCNRDSGARPATLEGRQAQALENLGWLMSNLVSDYSLTVSVVVPGSAALTQGQRTRVCPAAQVSAISDAAWNSNRTQATLTVGFKNPDVYWRALGGSPLDAAGWMTVSRTGPGALVLPTNIYPMNGYIEDAIITVKNAGSVLKTISIKSANAGSGTLQPEMNLTTPRAAGLLAANATLTLDCRKHTAVVDSPAESVYKFTDHRNGRPGTMLRIGKPYSLTVAYTPFATGAAVSGVVLTVKYRPSFF